MTDRHDHPLRETVSYGRDGTKWTHITIPPISTADLEVAVARDGFDATFPGLARPCPECQGSGRVAWNQTCLGCKGTGDRTEVAK